jgi:5-methyltetrahydrofolate--homocysteine methyltransferase
VRRSPAVRHAPVQAPPFWGHRTLALEWRAFDQLLAHVDRNTLFRHHWKYTVHDRAAWQRLVDEELEPRLQTLWADARVRRWLTPRAIYGYFPVQADGNDLVVYDPQAYAADGRTLRERLRFAFPRQVADGTKRNQDQLCLADYFRPVESGAADVAPLQVVTAGEAASAYTERLRQAGEYNQELEVHGVAAQAAEALAEYVHAHVRRELGLPPHQGQRYSWGYPACPDLQDQAKLFRLLPATEQIGVALTESMQFVPEQSTAAIVVHHPQAKYFSVLAGPDGGAESLAAG